MDMKEVRERERERTRKGNLGKTLLYIDVCSWALPINKPRLDFPLSAKLDASKAEKYR